MCTNMVQAKADSQEKKVRKSEFFSCQNLTIFIKRGGAKNKLCVTPCAPLWMGLRQTFRYGIADIIEFGANFFEMFDKTCSEDIRPFYFKV